MNEHWKDPKIRMIAAVGAIIVAICVVVIVRGGGIHGQRETAVEVASGDDTHGRRETVASTTPVDKGTLTETAACNMAIAKWREDNGDPHKLGYCSAEATSPMTCLEFLSNRDQGTAEIRIEIPQVIVCNGAPMSHVGNIYHFRKFDQGWVISSDGL
jgi:hypothetical protein